MGKQCGSMIFTVRVSTQDLDALIDHIVDKNETIDIIDFDGTRERVKDLKTSETQMHDLRVDVDDVYEGSNKESLTNETVELHIGDGDDIYTAVNTNDIDAV